MAKHIMVGSFIVALLLVTPHGDAVACGGCVAPPNTFSAVDSHRMVVKLGLEESILWDQFAYSGAPEEFAWVLPVPSPETVVEIADSAFIDVIDQETSPRVLSPECPGASSAGCGCGGFVSQASLAEEVEVHSHAMVGPYETVVIGADDPNALYAWLGQNGYAFPVSGLAVLDEYTARKSSFVVLRLRPGVEVSAMQPVRVRFKGYMGQFPLKMISLGASGAVELSLWIIAEQRYAPANFQSRRIDPADLSWDWETNTSNYRDVFEQTLTDAGGAAWITEYSQALEGSRLGDRLRSEAPVDHAMARAGIHYPVLTRLRTWLSVDALTEDLLLGPSDDPAAVARELVAGQSVGECAAPQPSGALPPPGDPRRQTFFWLLLALAVLFLRRRSLARRSLASSAPRSPDLD